HDAVGDLEDARQLVERVGVAREEQQVIRALALVVDLVRELAAAPRLVLLDRAAAALDELAGPRHDLVLALLRQLGIEHEQPFVCVVHGPRNLLSSLGLVALPAGAARECGRDGKAGSRPSVASAPCKTGPRSSPAGSPRRPPSPTGSCAASPPRRRPPPCPRIRPGQTPGPRSYARSWPRRASSPPSARPSRRPRRPWTRPSPSRARTSRSGVASCTSAAARRPSRCAGTSPRNGPYQSCPQLCVVLWIVVRKSRSERTNDAQD